MKAGIRLGVMWGVLLLLTLPAAASGLRLVPYSSAVFTMKVPEGGDIHTAGQCIKLSFVPHGMQGLVVSLHHGLV